MNNLVVKHQNLIILLKIYGLQQNLLLYIILQKNGRKNNKNINNRNFNRIKLLSKFSF